MSDHERQFLKSFEIELEQNPSIKGDPSALALLIINTIKELDQSKMILGSSKQRIDNIQQRSWVKQLFSVGDMAASSSQLVEAIELQNHSLESFLTLIKSVVSLNIGNMQFLIRLSDELSSGFNKVTLKDSTIFNMARSLLDEAIKEANYHDKEIAYLKLFIKNEVEDLKNLYASHQDAIKKLDIKVQSIKMSKKREGFRWPFYGMVALNLIIILMILSIAIKKIFI